MKMSDIKGPVLQQVGAWASKYISGLIEQYTDKELSDWQWGASNMFYVFGSRQVKKLISGEPYGFPCGYYTGPEPWHNFRVPGIKSVYNSKPHIPIRRRAVIEDKLFRIWLEASPDCGDPADPRSWSWVVVRYCIVANRQAVFETLEELFGSMVHTNRSQEVLDINNRILQAGDKVCYSITTTNDVFTGTIDRFTDLCIILTDGTTLQKTQKVLKV